MARIEVAGNGGEVVTTEASLASSGLVSLLKHPRLRRMGRALLVLLTVSYFVFALTVIGVRYAVLPNINAYRGNVERLLSASLNLPVSITGIKAEWKGLNPHLALSGFIVRDAEGRPALAFDHVEADVFWNSLMHLELRLRKLEIAAPSLSIRRDDEGRVFVAGLKLNTESQDYGFSDWLLEQHHIVVRDASIIWHDELRGAPPLKLDHLDFDLQNDGRRHRFGLAGDPPKELAARLDVRGDFRGDDLNPFSATKGEIYAQIAYADLAVWRTWINYPLELPRGTGSMRVWLDFAQRELVGFTGDVDLAQAEMRLAPDLPLLELQGLSGRLSGRRFAHGFELSAKGLGLTMVQGTVVTPTDFRLRWSEANGAAVAHGAFSATGLDLAALSTLAAHLPLPANTHRRLAEAAPRGKLANVSLSWSGPTDAPTGYAMRARFENLGMRAIGMLPGFEGLSGSIEGSDQRGSLTLASKNAALQLPMVFAEPRFELSSLNAQASWQMLKEGFEARVTNAAFENRDAAGVASGSYRGKKGELGHIDLSARLKRADATALWRYIPKTISKEVRDWLHAGIRKGISDDTTLRLKGDLKRFPYTDGSGIFEVKGKFHDGTLRYAQDWPEIDNITGTLEFIGHSMTITASRGRIYDVGLTNVKAQIDDLRSDDEILIVSGRAMGPSTNFLRFIAASPVAAKIEHYTDGMTVSGNGQLTLRLVLPLDRPDDAKVNGSYQFVNNRLVPDPDLPPVTELNGRLQFTGDSLKASRLRANFLDMPVSFDLNSTDEGAVTVTADGGFSIAALRLRYANPVFEHLSGNSTWHGVMRVRKKNVDFVLESKLQGISSSLPGPFNKSATETRPLRFERKPLVGPPPRADAVRRSLPGAPLREQIDIALGTTARARLIRRQNVVGGEKTIERGAIAIGTPIALPDRGLALNVRQKEIDGDFWRVLVNQMEGGDQLLPAFSAIDVEARELRLFGRSLNDLSLKASPKDGGWHAVVKSREATGELDWHGQAGSHEGGRLSAHLQQLAVGDKATTSSIRSDEVLKTLPDIDVEVDEFLLRNKPLGKLKLNADNRGGVWDARFEIDNSDGNLSGTGKWEPSRAQPDIHLQFTLNVKSIERLLARLGYPDVVRRGQASLTGTVFWNGAPFAIDYPSLGGELEIGAAAGQFYKLEPGAGRLLGILSLQSLPRRISLDFRDIFSEGFAFDAIAGHLNIKHGIIESKDLRIQGSGAKILMTGSANLSQETQDLMVHVQPSVGESLSVGAVLFAHPAIGAIAYLAQKLLRDPIDQLFSYGYRVTGTWADPVVTKLSAPKAGSESRKTEDQKSGAGKAD